MDNQFRNYFDIQSACKMKGLVHVFLFDKNHVILNSNQTQMDFMYEILGVEASLGCSITELLNNESDMAKVICEENEQIMSGGLPQQFYNELEFANKYKVEFLTTKMPIYGENGKVQGVFGIANYINKFSIAKAAAMGLSERETKCLFYLLEGKCNSEVAEHMQVSIRTVEDYIQRAKAKFGCATKAGLLLKALDCKIKESIKDELFSS